MAAVADAFAVYTSAAADAGITVGDYMAMGLPPAEVADRLAAIGVEPIESLVEWFGLTNGFRNDASAPSSLFDGRAVLSLNDAIADYQQSTLPQGDEPAIYKPAWFPIIGDPPMVVIDTASGEVLTVDLQNRTETTAGSLGEWIVAQSTSIPAPTDLSEFRHSYFEPGENELHPLDSHFLSKLAVFMAERPLRLLRATHAEPGSIVGNEGLERRQAELVIEHLIAEGAPIEGIVEYRIAPPPPDGHVVRIYGSFA